MTFNNKSTRAVLGFWYVLGWVVTVAFLAFAVALFVVHGAWVFFLIGGLILGTLMVVTRELRSAGKEKPRPVAPSPVDAAAAPANESPEARRARVQARIATDPAFAKAYRDGMAKRGLDIDGKPLR